MPSSSSSSQPYTTRTAGEPFTPEFRLYIERVSDHELVSPWHDIPLYPDKGVGVRDSNNNNNNNGGDKAGETVNMVVEIPRFGNAKMEIAKDEFLTPIKQDMKKGQLRYIPNVFPYTGYAWNYGALPQTWEDPSTHDPDTHTPGDDDPLDVCEIGSAIAFAGEVKVVKILGAIVVIDQGETDWKVIAIDVRDELADKIHKIDDMDVYMPGFIDSMKYWFSVYKVPEGKPENTIGLGGNVKGQEFAISLVNDAHESWQKIVYNELRPPHKDSLKDIGIVEHRDLRPKICHTPPADLRALQPPKTAGTDKSYFLKTYNRDVGWNKAIYGTAQ